MKKSEKGTITDLNAPNGSRDIPSESQEFEQDGCRHFVGFQPYFHVDMTSQTQSLIQDNEKIKVQYLGSLLFDLFEILKAVRSHQRNFA